MDALKTKSSAFSASSSGGGNTNNNNGGSKIGLVHGLKTGLRCGLDAFRRRVRRQLEPNQTRRDVRVVFGDIVLFGFASVAGTEVISLSKKRAEASKAIRECSTMLDLNTLDKEEGGKNTLAKKSKKKKKGPRGATDAQFWQELKYLLRIAFPTPTCRGSQLLSAQFSLLVMRALLTVGLIKSTRLLDSDEGTADWKFGVRWYWNFIGWMTCGVVVNSGLRYTESLIQVELRSALDEKSAAKST